MALAAFLWALSGDGCVKLFLAQLKSEDKPSIDERAARRPLETAREREGSGVEALEFDPKSVGDAGRRSKLTVETRGKRQNILYRYSAATKIDQLQNNTTSVTKSPACCC